MSGVLLGEFLLYCCEFPGFLCFISSDVMRDNMLINVSGHDEHWYGADMNIEHYNKAQQVRNHCM